jgi:hypothetical protein
VSRRVGKEPPPFGYCFICGCLERVWKFNEEIVESNPRAELVVSNSVCTPCLKALMEAALEED